MIQMKDERRKVRNGGAGLRMLCVISLFSSLISISCTDNHAGPTSRPLTAEEKQQQLLNDPFGYKPDTTKVDITGGDIGHFDKDAFKKDVDHVLSP